MKNCRSLAKTDKEFAKTSDAHVIELQPAKMNNGARKGAYRVLVEKPERRRPLGRARRRWEDNIKIDF
jgi:hypothetical protein